MKKFPFIRQHDGMQCGAACLVMICKYYGQCYSLEQISELCQVTTEGVSLKALADSADALGMETLSARITEHSPDAKNERTIVENLDNFYKGRTVIVVAHRLSTVKNADQIIVPDGGKVIETGNHACLIEKKGTYFNLVKNQLELGN